MLRLLTQPRTRVMNAVSNPSPISLTSGLGNRHFFFKTKEKDNASKDAKIEPGAKTDSEDVPTIEPQRSRAPQQVMKFRDLQQFIRTKETVDEAHVRQMVLAQQYRPVRYLGRGRFGKVFLCADGNDQLRAVKVLNVERDRREYNWTWLTAEERQQSQADAKRLRDFIDGLSSGLVKDHMMRAEEMLLDTMRREENPLLRKVRRPVAEREILVRIGSHPFVANLLGSFRDNRFMCLVFDYFPAGTLQKLIVQEGKMSEDLARFFASQLLLALVFLQAKNVAHRDVKPSNILLTKEGFIALADFGLATRLKGGLKTFCGTAEYIAPEVLSEKMWSAGGLDLWAFGITLYQMIVGRTPFEAPDATSVFLNTLTAPLKIPDHVSPEAASLLKSILSRDATLRPSGQEVQRHAFFKGVDWEGLLSKKSECIPHDLASRLKINFWDERQQEVKMLQDPPRAPKHFESLLK